MQGRGCLLLTHHPHEHIHKHRLKSQLTLNHPLPSSYFRPGVLGKGRDAPRWLPAPGMLCIPQHSHAEAGSSAGICWDAVPELETTPGVSGGVKCSGKATGPGAGVLGGAVGWEELPARPSAVDCAQHNIPAHPSLPQRLKSQISEPVNQSFLCCPSRKTFLGAYFRMRGIMPLPEILTLFLYPQKVPVKGTGTLGSLQTPTIAQTEFQPSPGPAGLNRMHPNF